MSYFRNIFSKYLKIDTIPLGRWTINYNESQLKRKVYLANYDHCGPCGSIVDLPKIKNMDYSINGSRK